MIAEPMQPAFIDFHDAVLSSITFHSDASLIVDFNHLNCFYSAGPDEYEVWLCVATIGCSGVRAFELKGKLEPDVCLLNGSMQDSQGSEVPTLSKDETPSILMRLTMMSGTEIRWSMESAKLLTLSLVQQLERWTGPLR
jgi:hypothetical protein